MELAKMKNDFSMESLLRLLSKYKKKIIIVSIGGVVVYYLYRKFLSEKVNFVREFYNTMSEYQEKTSKSTFESISQQYDSSFNNLIPRLLEEISDKLEKEYSTAKLFDTIKTARKEELHKLWILYKNKVFVSFYCSIFIPRTLLLLSQTHLLLIEKLNLTNDKNLPKSFYEDLLTDLWMLAVGLIEYLTKTLELKLNPIAEEILLKDSFTKEKFISELRKFRQKVEEFSFDLSNSQISLKILERYYKHIENKISLLETNAYSNDIKGMKIDSFLRFYQIYYDVIRSNLFQVILMKALDYDFFIMEDAIELNFENEKKQNTAMNKLSIPKIISFLYRMTNQNLNSENTIFLLKGYKNHKFPSELSEFFKIIYD